MCLCIYLYCLKNSITTFIDLFISIVQCIERFGTDDGKMNHQSIDMYEGPAFKTLGDDLQESMYAYLHERGITAELPEQIVMLAQAKEQQEYTNWLAQLEDFLLYDPLKATGKDSKKNELPIKKGQ